MSSVSESPEPNTVRRSFSSVITSLSTWGALSGVLVFSVSIALSLLLASCSPSNESAVPLVQVTRNPQQLTTRTPAPSVTRTFTRTPTLTSTPKTAPTPPANGVSLALAPDLVETGWVRNDAAGMFTPDNDLNVGVLKGQVYSSIVQFDLSQLAPGSSR